MFGGIEGRRDANKRIEISFVTLFEKSQCFVDTKFLLKFFHKIKSLLLIDGYPFARYFLHLNNLISYIMLKLFDHHLPSSNVFTAQTSCNALIGKLI